MKKFNATINGQNRQEISETEIDAFNFIQRANGDYYVIVDNINYLVKVQETDFASKSFRLSIGNRSYHVKLAGRVDQLIEDMGLDRTNHFKVNNIMAPMPGMVLEVKVAAGDAVKKGDSLIILEAMKMENIIAAPNDGMVDKVLLRKGDAVNKSQLMIVLK
jgi:biotin carboxyl carrier protein